MQYSRPPPRAISTDRPASQLLHHWEVICSSSASLCHPFSPFLHVRLMFAGQKASSRSLALTLSVGPQTMLGTARACCYVKPIVRAQDGLWTRLARDLRW